jgi:hypothetical protein
MRSLVVGAVLAGFVGSAAAGDNLADARYADGNDYSAKLFYAVDFGGKGNAQSLGLRFDNELAASRGAPALFQASFDNNAALPTLSLQGVTVAGPAMAAGQASGGFFASLSAAQVAGLVFTGLVFAGIVVEAADSDDPVTSGTGAN